MTRTLTLAGAKHGAGTSTLAAALAAYLARNGETVDLVATDGTDDLAAILGCGTSAAEPGTPFTVAPRLTLVDASRGGYPNPDADWRIIDAGTIDTVRRGDALPLVIVARECYLHLRHMTTNRATLDAAAGIALIQEPGRALGASDVAQVTERPILARLPHRMTVARAVDAGVIGTRVPGDLVPGLIDLAAVSVNA